MNVLNLKLYCLFLFVFSALCLNAQHQGNFTATGDIKSESSKFKFGDTQDLTAWVNGSIVLNSDNQIYTQLILRNGAGTTGGKLLQANENFGLTDSQGRWTYRSKLNDFTSLNIGGKSIMRLEANGKVKIGAVDITPNGYKLFVEDGILAERVRVAVNRAPDWADFVFEDDYDLMPLSDVKTFIEDNDHLPNVPSAEQMVESGLDVLESDAILLRKIEEAYLYILQQQEQLDELKKEIANLRN